MRRKLCASISRPLECGPAAPYIIAMTTTPTLTDAAATRVAAIAAKQAKPAIQTVIDTVGEPLFNEVQAEIEKAPK